MGDVKTTINGSFQDTENTGTSGGACQPGVEVAAESTRLAIDIFDIVLVTIDISCALIDVIQLVFLQDLQQQFINGRSIVHWLGNKLKSV